MGELAYTCGNRLGNAVSLKVISRTMPSVPSAPMNNFLVGGGLLGVLLEVRNDSVDREVDTALQVHRVHAGATAFAPSRTIAAASTVGVVVPSPPASALRLGFDCGVAVRPQCHRRPFRTPAMQFKNSQSVAGSVLTWHHRRIIFQGRRMVGFAMKLIQP